MATTPHEVVTAEQLLEAPGLGWCELVRGELTKLPLDGFKHGVLNKVQQWLDAGCQMVWLIDPQRRTAAVYRAREHTVLHNDTDELADGDLLPGFRLRLGDIFNG